MTHWNRYSRIHGSPTCLYCRRRKFEEDGTTYDGARWSEPEEMLYLGLCPFERNDDGTPKDMDFVKRTWLSI